MSTILKYGLSDFDHYSAVALHVNRVYTIQTAEKVNWLVSYNVLNMCNVYYSIKKHQST